MTQTHNNHKNAAEPEETTPAQTGGEQTTALTHPSDGAGFDDDADFVLPDLSDITFSDDLPEEYPEGNPDRKGADSASDTNNALTALPSTPAPVPQKIPARAVYDVPVVITAVLGQRKIDVASLLDLSTGSIIDLNKKVGEPIDLYVNDQLIARGELVVADGALGISMTEIVRERRLSETPLA